MIALAEQTLKPIAGSATDIVPMEDLRRLAAQHETPCVSLYFPLEARGADVGQNPAVLKNLLRKAESELESWPVESEELLAPLQDLLRDKAFWKQQSGGVAAFLSPAGSATFRLPGSTPERLRVGERFDLAPLLSLAAEAGHFYILAVSLNAVRLLEGASGGFRQVEIPDLPTDFQAALGYEQYDTTVQYHSASPGARGKQPPLVHGHGDSDEDRLKKDILNYFRRIGDALLPAIDRAVPIVLAAVGAYFPICRQALGEDRVLEAGVEGNPELLSDLELWQQAYGQVILPAASQRRSHAADHLRELADRARVAHGFEDLALASLHGRVDTVLIDPEIVQWGTVDTEHCHVTLADQPPTNRGQSQDLAAFILCETLANGGVAVPLTQDEAGDIELPAAILRY